MNTEHRTPNRLSYILTLALLFSTILSYTQDRQDYYIEIDSLYTFNVLSKTVNLDETLTFDLDDNNFESFLNSQEIYYFEKAYPASVTPRLQRVYVIRINDNVNVNTFLSRNEVFLFFPVEGEPVLTESYDLSSNYYPDDFMDYFEDFPNSDLMLIRAPLAWTITKGNPNLVFGISDSNYNFNHEDIQGKITDNIVVIPNNHWHGTAMVSVMAGNTNNNLGISSIGYNSKVVAATCGPTAGGLINGLLQLSQYPNMRLINCSWSISETHPLKPDLDDVIEEVIDNGVLVIASAGNANSTSYMYPASYESTLSVTSVGNRYPIGYHHNIVNPTNNTICPERSWLDVHRYYPHNPSNNASHTRNDKVNVSAPGHLVLMATSSPDYHPNIYRIGSGTSPSAAMTSGLAALVFATNPNLTAPEVKDIIESTTDNIYHIPYNQDYIGLLGTGRINAYRAVMKVHCMGPGASPNPQLDLMIRNSYNDFGVEPDNTTQTGFWNSQDIWVRNQQDGTYIYDHQNPEYSPTQPNYIYVRVTNRSCVTSSGNDVLKVYWAKANTALSWPTPWNGTVVNGVVMGGEIPTFSIPTIPVLEPGQEAILEIPWMVPNPANYIGINPNPWHFCLLARIISDDDPMTNENTDVVITENVKNNNNIGWKNTTIVDLIPDLVSNKGGVVAVSNPYDETKTFRLEFFKEAGESGKPIYEEAEAGVTLDSLLHASWVAGGSLGSDFTSPNAVSYKKVATGNNMVLDNITLAPGAFATMYVSFNFLMSELTDKRKFVWHVAQVETSSNAIVGGETYIINKLPRPSFDAFAGNDETIEKNESVTLYADPINENAVYNWYDPDGNLIYTGTDLTVSPLITQTYKLEVITDTDGFKDYDEVTVTVNPYKIQSLVPNPASSQVTVNYDVEGATSAYIMLVNQTTSNSDNYILDIEETAVTIDTSSYPTGLYSVILVVNGEIQSSKNLMIQ